MGNSGTHPSLATETRRQLEYYVDGQISLRDLWLWLMTNVVLVRADQADTELRTVLGDTVLFLFEWTGRHISEEDVRRCIARQLDLAPGSRAVTSRSTAAPAADKPSTVAPR